MQCYQIMINAQQRLRIEKKTKRTKVFCSQENGEWISVFCIDLLTLVVLFDSVCFLCRAHVRISTVFDYTQYRCFEKWATKNAFMYNLHTFCFNAQTFVIKTIKNIDIYVWLLYISYIKVSDKCFVSIRFLFKKSYTNRIRIRWLVFWVTKMYKLR